MFKIRKLIISNDKLKGTKILVISDIHYSGNKDIKKLEKVYNKLLTYDANYICIPGDIIDNYDLEDKSYILDWIKRLSNNYKIIISLGNHDLRSKIDIGKYKSFIDEKFISKLKKINNVYLLNNSSIEFDKIYFYGYTQSFDYYYINKYEDANIMKSELKKYKVCDNLPNKYKVLLMHSPLHINDEDIKHKLNNYDLILSGHMHNGMVPPIIDEIFKNDIGIISPQKKIFPRYARGIVKDNNTVVISSGITKISNGAPKLLHLFRLFYPIGIDIIEFK